MEEDDLFNNPILSELAESMDNGGRGGFVSTFSLAPLAVNGGVDSFGSGGAETLGSVDSTPASDPDPFRTPQSRRHLPQSTPTSGRSGIFRPASPRSNAPSPPSDLLSPQSIASDSTDMMSNKMSPPLSPPAVSRHAPSPSFDTSNTTDSTPPRSDAITNSKPSGKSSHDNCTNDTRNNKRKKGKPSSRKNNLVILPWNNIRSKSDISSNKYNSSSATQRQHHQHPLAANYTSSQKSPPLPPPHPLSHVQSYPPQYHYYSGAHHLRSYSFASDASSSEATPIAGVRRHAYSISSVDIGEPALSLGDAIDGEKTADEERGISLLRFDRENCTGTDVSNDGDSYFQDFDDTLSKDSTGINIPAARTESDLIGVNIHMTEQPIVDLVPHSISTSSLLGLSIPQREKHRQVSSLQYSPSTLVTFVENDNPMSMPMIPAAEVGIPSLTLQTKNYEKHDDGELHDDGSTLSNLPSVMDDRSPASPNPYLKSPTKRHHKHHSSLVSCSESCLQSQCSITSLESYNILHYPNPDPQSQPEQIGTPNLFEPNCSPLDSSYSYEEDRSLCEEEKMFVQAVHNSGLSTLSFEHVEDTLESTSMDVEMELVYNSGSFDNGSVGGSVESGSVMSVEERKEIERRIDCYRKIRQKKRKKKTADDRAVESSGDGQEEDTRTVEDHVVRRQDHTTIEDDQAVLRVVPASTPLASNKTCSVQVYSPPNNFDAIDEFNQQQDDQFESLEMTPLTLTKSSTAFNNEDEDTLGGRDPVEHPSYRESKLHPNTNTRWIAYYSVRNFVWWCQLKPSHFQNMSNGASKGPNRTGQRSRYDYNYKGFDDVDFDRNSSYCYRCFCPRSQDEYNPSQNVWYMQTSWGQLLCIACVFLLLAWVFSDGGLQKHRSQQASYPDYHRTKNGYHLYDRDDPLSREQFLNPVSRLDDDVDQLAIPIEDDIDYSFAERYFPEKQQQGVEVDDVFMQFEAEDDLFNEVDDIYSSQVSQAEVDTIVVSDDSILEDSTTSILAGLATEDEQSGDIDTIVVLGERHVGIEWLVTKLVVLYPSITISSGFPADEENHLDGMWFQPKADTKSSSTTKHILVIALFLNPFDWVELMRVDPIYAPDHKSMEWRNFVESEWSPINHDSGKSDGIDAATTKSEAKSTVLEIPDDDDDADWDDIVISKTPKRGNLRRLNSFYEIKLGGSGYYGSILALRADKIRAAVKGSLYRPDVFASLPVRYEDLIEPYKENSSSSMDSLKSSSALPGIVGLVGQIQSLTGISPDVELTKSFFADPIGCTGHICRHPSIEKMRHNTEYIEYLNNHIDWHAEALVGYQKMSTKPSVERIVVLGERHSGAEWLVDRLSRCFPDVEVAYGFDRPGKFFQSPAFSTINTLVVAVFTNPYNFIERMRQNPINAPAHANMEWSEFVTSNWERTRSNLDSIVVDTSTESCSFGFSFHEIIPCHTQRDPDSDDFPLYELRHSPSNGVDTNTDKPYSNLLELRADKIQNFLSTAHYPEVVHLIKLRYEDLVWESEFYTDDASPLTLPFPGIAGLLEKIRDHTTLTPDVSAGWILDEKGFFKAESLSVETGIDEDYMTWLNEHIDWSVEALVGYGMPNKE